MITTHARWLHLAMVMGQIWLHLVVMMGPNGNWQQQRIELDGDRVNHSQSNMVLLANID
jgi:hypothetical protein